MSIFRALLLAVTLLFVPVGTQSHTSSRDASAAMTFTPSAGEVSASADATYRVDAGGASDAHTSEREARDVREAKRVLAELKGTYRYLDDVTVSLGDTPNGEEAVAYYTQGRIVVSRTHSVEISKILSHEIWHIIDWRDNGRLDWAEELPPKNSTRFLDG